MYRDNGNANYYIIGVEKALAQHIYMLRTRRKLKALRIKVKRNSYKVACGFRVYGWACMFTGNIVVIIAIVRLLYIQVSFLRSLIRVSLRGMHTCV